MESEELVQELTETEYAEGRRPENLYYSKRFSYRAEHATHEERIGTKARIAWIVFDSNADVKMSGTSDGYDALIRETPKARQQIKAVFFEDDRHICFLHLQRINGQGAPLKDCFTLRDQEIEALRDMFDCIPVVDLSDDAGERLSGTTIDQVLRAPEAWQRMYEEHGRELADLVREDVTATDIIALARRKKQLGLFEQMLDDPALVDRLMGEWGKKQREQVWQQFFDDNRWIFGLGLSSQLLLAWQPEKLEAVIQGYSVATRGKRTDALLRSEGPLSGLCFVEIKLPTARLMKNVKDPYRPDAWVPDTDVIGGVAQLHATVDHATNSWNGKLEKVDNRGFKRDEAYLVRPRSYLVVGSLTEFVDGTSVAEPPFRSFENYRRTLQDPEIITYDELLARAQFLVMGEERSQPEHAQT